jgi:RecJ-like exonuclease
VPEKKVTVPVAVDGETVAVSVTLAPTVGVVVDATRAVVVAVLVEVTVMLTALDVLVAKVVDPA